MYLGLAWHFWSTRWKTPQPAGVGSGLKIWERAAILVPLALMGLQRLFAPRRPNPEKLEIYECGVPAVGSAHQRLPVGPVRIHEAGAQRTRLRALGAGLRAREAVLQELEELLL